MTNTIHFSEKALKNQRLGSFIELCNNDCGAWVYYDIETKTVRNAEYHKSDSLHWQTCSTLKHAWMIASSHNWFPSYSFMDQAQAFIKSAKEMYLVAIALEKSLEMREEHNHQAKIEWDEEKKRKTQEKQNKRRAV